MSTAKERRDNLAYEHFEKREKLFDLWDFSNEVIATESYKPGFDAGITDEVVKALVEALEGLTNAALAGIKPIEAQASNGFYALKEYQKAIEELK